MRADSFGSSRGGASGRASGFRAVLVRLALGAILGAAVRAFAILTASATAWLGIDLYGSGAFLAGVVFGWTGAAGYWLGDAAVEALANGRGPSPSLLAAALVIGVGGFLAFRLTSRVDRRIRDLRSYATLLVGAAIVSFPATILVVRAVFPAFTWSAVFVWQAATLASVALIGPPALILLPHRLWALREPIARETARRAAHDPGSEPSHADSSSGIALRRPARRLLDVAITVGAVGAVHFALVAAGPRGPFNHWFFLGYSVPLLFAAYRGGLRGGLLAGSLVGLSLLLPNEPWLSNAASHLATVERQAGVLVFSILGACAGAMRDRERNLTRQLERSNRVLRRDLERVLAALRSAMEAKDQYTEGHLRRVSRFALEVGRRLKLLPHELELLEIASLLHDVGKIGIADSVLRKPGPLDERERVLMQQHPLIGARILENIDGLQEAADMVRHHQERFDGVAVGAFPGYPDGLAGRAIPLGARIIAVVDAFDAMTSDRPYRDSIGYDRARHVLVEESGRQFDPRVVETFLQLLNEREWDETAMDDEEEAEQARA